LETEEKKSNEDLLEIIKLQEKKISELEKIKNRQARIKVILILFFLKYSSACP